MFEMHSAREGWQGSQADLAIEPTPSLVLDIQVSGLNNETIAVSAVIHQKAEEWDRKMHERKRGPEKQQDRNSMKEKEEEKTAGKEKRRRNEKDPKKHQGKYHHQHHHHNQRICAVLFTEDRRTTKRIKRR